MFATDSVVTEFSGATGSAAAATPVISAVEPVTGWIAGLTVASVEAGCFAIQDAVAPTVRNPCRPGTAAIAIDHLIGSAVRDGFIWAGGATVLADLHARAIP